MPQFGFAGPDFVFRVTVCRRKRQPVYFNRKERRSQRAPMETKGDKCRLAAIPAADMVRYARPMEAEESGSVAAQAGPERVA